MVVCCFDFVVVGVVSTRAVPDRQTDVCATDGPTDGDQPADAGRRARCKSVVLIYTIFIHT